jgi:hypothetical protein
MGNQRRDTHLLGRFAAMLDASLVAEVSLGLRTIVVCTSIEETVLHALYASCICGRLVD